MTFLTYERILAIQSLWINEKAYDKSLIRDWTEFVFKAGTIGVTQFDIDNWILSDDDWDKKYERN